MEDFPYNERNRSFSIGTITGEDGKFPGPGSYWVEKVELFVNPGKKYKYFHNPATTSLFSFAVKTREHQQSSTRLQPIFSKSAVRKAGRHKREQ